MSVKVGAAISTEEQSFDAGAAAGRAVAEALDGAPADLTLVFASGQHLGAPEAALEAVHAALAPGALVGWVKKFTPAVPVASNPARLCVLKEVSTL